ncbi:MAG: MATE family efflux transporter [Defluviitaleaceae bacterium]|nr:MATE family efflux transporter [Defluviitaleaceae bacterium]
MKNNAATVDLTQGKIFSSLLKLSLPIAGVQVMHMAYNITDMFWLGRVSSDALAASGAAGLFLWLSVGLMIIGRVGAEVGVAQSRGKGDEAAAYRYSRTAFYISAMLGLLYAFILILFQTPLIGFFNFQEAHVAADAATYVSIMALGIPAVFMSSSIDGAFVASGNSRTPFLIGSAGLIFNMILTPIFIFPLGLGVFGAAASSIIAQYTVFAVRIIAIKRFKSRPFDTYQFAVTLNFSAIIDDLRTGTSRDIFKLTIPICLEQTLFPLLTMVTTRFEVSFGAFALTMSRVGSQIESLSWLVGAGFGAALTAFVGQNFGAGKMDRIAKGVKYTACSLGFWGIFVTAVMWFGGDIIFTVFIPEYAPDPEMRRIFITYLRILSACQLLANLEFAATNALRGKGKTIPPSVISITSNVIRVPLAFGLSLTPLGLLGIWTAVSITAGLRGAAVCLWYMWDTRQEKKRMISNPIAK